MFQIRKLPLLFAAGTVALFMLAPADAGAQQAPATPSAIEAVPIQADGTDSTDSADRTYSVGETIAWDISVPPSSVGDATKVLYTIKEDGLTEIKHGELTLDRGKGVLQTSLDEPGTVLVELKLPGDSSQRKLIGAAVEIEKIKPSQAEPEDFDEFWKQQIGGLAEIAANPKLEKGDSKKADVDYYLLQMDNINGSKIYGQLAQPKSAGKRPALLMVQWAGVYGLQPSAVINHAKQGWLTLNIMAHDLPLDKPAAFYEQARKTTQKDYIQIGCESKETSYFLRMYLACYRAAEYLSTRDDWDGKTLVVMGSSMGGQQAIVTAGLHPKVTAMIAMVPAGCDVTGPIAGRATGYPYWSQTANYRDNPEILETGRYFDAVHFAARIQCTSLIGMGLIDETCPPTGVFATCNQIDSPLERFVLATAAHQNQVNTHAPFWKRRDDWLDALVNGKSPEVVPLVITSARESRPSHAPDSH